MFSGGVEKFSGGRGDVENFQVGLRIVQSKLKFLTKLNCSK